MKKESKDEFSDTSKWIPTACAVCDSCFLRVHPITGQVMNRCLYGGPFRAYGTTEATTGPNRPEEQSKEASG